ncbi:MULTISPECIES: DUF1592 domain-containing protein [Lysobacter]|uniref:DUF1592 domain-containing protein n=1 Tax=Lysobacter TaxID=68 RepID=UPI001F32AD3F|nr:MULTISPECIES: DUF1592 domain-containing protein [Lysobacter]UJB19170.1 DUF1592 domain-containing protein [Lysobacter capsici]UJQ27105.1 DUF1592 domain-containing protein [Lysobacter gummosus]
MNASASVSASRRLCFAATVALSLIVASGCDRGGKSGGVAAKKAGSALQCDAPPYLAGTSYVQGDRVQNKGQLYECWRDEDGPPQGIGSWAWCAQSAYEPGGPDPDWWPNAWKHIDSCDGGGGEGNQLILRFAMASDTVLNNRIDAAAAPSASTPVTGTLRCKGEETPVSGTWGAGIKVEALSRCDYHLTLNAIDGRLPLTSPAKVTFALEAGDRRDLLMEYRPALAIDKLRTIPGMKIEVFAQGMRQPRQMAMGKGVLYVGSSAIPSYAYKGISGFVYALPLDAAGRPTGAVHLIASSLEEPMGVAYRDGDLYYSTTGALHRVRNVDATYKDAHSEQVLKFPADDTLFPLPALETGSQTRVWHMKHPLHFNPYDADDDGLYTAIGTPCNLCMVPADPRYGTLLRYDLGTGSATVIAKGVRNSVGFDWHPDTRQIWFGDNNRQGFANPEEINRLATSGQHFGRPYVFGHNTMGFTQAEYDRPLQEIVPNLVSGAIVSDKPLASIDPKDYVPPALQLAGNTSPSGLKFWNGVAGPDGTRRFLVAQHGLGREAARPGMNLLMVTVASDSRVVQEFPVIDGWIQDFDKADAYCLTPACVGRPTDLLVLDERNVLLSDDVAGVIYKLSYDPSGLRDASLALQPGESPSQSIAGEMIGGTLVDPEGHKRYFQLAWKAPAIVLNGIADGAYNVHMADIETDDGTVWIPLDRDQQITIDASNKHAVVQLGYRELPEGIAADVRVRAPPKPASAEEAQWHVDIRTGNNSRRQAIPWGGTATITLPYGKHDIVYPYYPGALPQPSLQHVPVNEETQDFDLEAMSYREVGNLGEVVLAETCINCHSPEFFDDPRKALTWEVAGTPALIARIKAMPLSGHCDDACAGAVSSHLIDTVWAPYLNPTESFGARQVRLLATHEYLNSVADLFHVAVNPAKLPTVESDREFKYPGQADLGVLSAEAVRKYFDMAVEVAAKADLASLGYHAGGDTRAFVSKTGRKVFRRQLSDIEIGRYAALATDEQGARDALAAMLVSPYFLYRSELGAPGHDGAAKLTAEELATALSFSFLGTTPDEALLDRAASGGLDTSEAIGAEVDRMMQSDAGIAQFARFIRYYTNTPREIHRKPGLDDDTIHAMQEEQRLFVGDMFKNGSATMDELFNPAYTYLNDKLAAHYGIRGVSGGEFRKIDVDDKRGGILHQGLTQVATSDYEATALVRRGIMIRENMFCHAFGAPVEAGPDEPEYPPRPISTRERWDAINGQHASAGRCWQCHQFMNDTGASMEHYDSAGRYRELERAYNFDQYDEMVRINAAGPLLDASGSFDLGPVENVRGIARILPKNPSAQACMADSYFRYAFGNKADRQSIGAVRQMSDVLKEGGSLREMLRTMALSQAYLYKKDRD